MSEDLDDVLLKEFIFAANECFDGGAFKANKRYNVVLDEFRCLPRYALESYALTLGSLGEGFKHFYDKFVKDLELGHS